jgi:N-methylhydantoinase A
VGKAFRAVAPDLQVCTSHEVQPVFREFERTSTTVVNAVALPMMTRYLEKVLSNLSGAGFQGDFAVMQSSGGLVDKGGACSRPVATLMSGPAGGVICAQVVGRSAGYASVINFDMGGTSCDVAAVTDGEPDRVTAFKVSGYPVQMPSLDIVSVGAGGGSIAWIDPGGALQVGPQSAGADPGPACYDRGGLLPTVTDAAVVLGRYSATATLGGSLPIDRERAMDSLRPIAEALGMSIEETAWGVLRLVNASMANALREVSVERGRDPRVYALVAAGGGGAAHAFEVGQELGIDTILVPPFPGVASAQGMLVADVRHEHAQTIHRLLDHLSEEELAGYARALITHVTEQVDSSAVRCDQVTAIAAAELRYLNQTYELTVPMAMSEQSPSRLAEAFHVMHRNRYGHAFEDAEIEIINLRAAAIGSLGVPDLGTPSWIEFPDSARDVYWGGTWGWLETPILPRSHVVRSDGLSGPLIVEQSDATIVVPPAAVVEPLAGGVLRITTQPESKATSEMAVRSEYHA